MHMNSAPLSIGSEEDAHDVGGGGQGPCWGGQRVPCVRKGAGESGLTGERSRVSVPGHGERGWGVGHPLSG